MTFRLAPFVRFAVLAMVPASFLAQPQKAEAILNFYVFPSATVNTASVLATGSVDLTGVSALVSNVGVTGRLLDAPVSIVATGPGPTIFVDAYTLTPVGSLPSPIPTGLAFSNGAGSGTGPGTGVFAFGGGYLLGLPAGYVSGTTISSTAEIPTQPAPGVNLSGSGTFAYNLFAGQTLVDQVNVIFDNPPAPPSSGVPAPLPMAGGFLAFGWSRKIRSRIALRKAVG